MLRDLAISLQIRHTPMPYVANLQRYLIRAILLLHAAGSSGVRREAVDRATTATDPVSSAADILRVGT